MKFPSLCIVLLSLASCSRRTCPLAIENQIKFSQSMKVVGNGQYGEVLVEEYRKAINFLSIVTGIDSKADYSNTFGYSNKNDFRTDMREWRKWYKKNKCMLTNSYIDSLYETVNLKRN